MPRLDQSQVPQKLISRTVFDLTHVKYTQTQTKQLTEDAGSSKRCQTGPGRDPTTLPVQTHFCTSHLIGVHQPGVREVERGDEEPDALALHAVTIQVVGDHPGHEVLARAGPAVEGEGQRLVGLGVVDKALDGFQDHRLSQVLSMELGLKVPRQTCTEQSKL